MTVIRAVLVDDEPLAREALREALRSESDVEIVGEYGDGALFLRDLQRLGPDVVFLDIEMPTLSGFDILERMRSAGPQPAVIFVTAFDGYAAKAFDVEPVDYVLKPFDSSRVSRAMMRIRRKVASSATAAAPRMSARFAVKRDEKIQIVRAEDIHWLEAAGNYARIHLADGAHLIRRTLNSFEEDLDRSRFVRISRSAIVNLDRVVQLQYLFRRSIAVLLQDGTKLRLNGAYRSRLDALVRGI